MNQKISDTSLDLPATGHKIELLHALNAAVASLQQSAHSEAEVLRAFSEQIVKLGLRGSLSLLDERKERLTVHVSVQPGQILPRLEKLTGLKAEGFEFDLAEVDIFRQVVETGETIFVADNSAAILQIVPPTAQSFVKRILKALGSTPAILAPLITGGQIFGVLNVDGAGLTSDDVPTITAFANHISVALNNARLFAALRQAESQYRRLFETANDGILVIDPVTTKILSANHKIAEMTGYTETELLAKPITVLHAVETGDRIHHFLETVRTEGQNTFEHTMYWRKGQKTAVQTSATMFRANDRQLMQFIIRDVTGQRKAEQVQDATNRISEATHSAQNLQELFRAIHDIIRELMPAENFYIAIYDEATDTINLPYFVDEFGDLPPPKCGKGLTAYVLRTGKPLLAPPEVFDELVRNGEIEDIGKPSVDWLGVPLQTEDKTIGVLVVQTYSEDVRFDEEDKDILVFVSTQVTMAIERKRAEEALRESEEKYRSLTDDVLDSSAAGILILDANFRVVWVNQALERYFKVQRDEIIGQDQRQLVRDRIKNIFEKPEIFAKKVLATYNNNTYDENFECHVLPEGQRQERWLEHRSQPIRSGLYAGGRIEHYYGITKRKKAEIALDTHARQQAALFLLSADLVATLDETDICQKVARGLHHTLNYDHIGLFLLDETTGERMLRASTGLSDVPSDLRLQPGQGLSERPLLDGRLHYTPDVTREPRYFRGVKDSQSEVDVPLQAGQNILGVLVVESRQTNAFDEDDFAVLTAAANQTAVALERARRHQAVKEAEIRYQTLFDRVPVGLYRTTPDGQILDANLTLVEMLGYPDRETLLTVSAVELYLDPGDRLRWQALIDQAGLVRDFETQMRQAGGTIIWVRDSSRAIRDKAGGEVLYYEGSLEEITEHRRAEEALKESEERYRGLVEASPDAIALINLNGDLIMTNQQGALLFGYQSVEELLSNRKSTFDLIMPENQQQAIEHVQKTLETGSVRNVEYTALRKDGTTFPAELSTSLVAI